MPPKNKYIPLALIIALGQSCISREHNVSKNELVETVAQVKEIILERKNYSKNELARFEHELKVCSEEVDAVLNKLLAIEKSGSEHEVNLWRKIYQSELDALEIAKEKWFSAKKTIDSGHSLLTPLVGDSFNQKALLLLAKSGLFVLYSPQDNLELVFDRIEQSMKLDLIR